MQIRLLFCLLLFIATTVYAGTPQPAPVPAWVTLNSVESNNSTLLQMAEDGVFDLAIEEQVNLHTNAHFYRKVIRLLSESGVQNNSEVRISFDPEYQQLVWHYVRVIRNAETIDKLKLVKIKTLQQEAQLDQQLYEGSLTASLILEDVRKGDVLEYSYSLIGHNPVLGQKFADIFNLQYSVPVGQLFYKVIVPNDRNLQVKSTGMGISPHIYDQASSMVYEWRLSSVPPLKLPENLPLWYDPFPAIHVSEYNNWQEVALWALNLYAKVNKLAPGVKAFSQQLQQKYKTKETQICAALRFVQDDVRYMGIEMGANSHLPHDPEQVFKQRYGDCKDKAFLLCTILAHLGITARPVLINSAYRSSIKNWMPSPIAFDHVTVQAILKGKTYYLDPTITGQRGTIDNISFPNYQVGLLVDQRTKELTAIEPQQSGRIKVLEEFFVKSMTGVATLEVTTNYSGSYADEVRDRFTNENLETIREGYLEFYRTYIKDIQNAKLQFIDDSASGNFTTVEIYELEKIWGEIRSLKKASFEPYIINGMIKRYKEQTSTHPLALSYPSNCEEDIVIHLPESWQIDHKKFATKGPGFNFLNEYKGQGKKVVLHYKYEVTKDLVGGIQYVGRGAVVLLQLNHFYIVIIALKLQDVLNGGAAKRIDALGIVAHHAHIFMRRTQQLDDLVLRRVGILVLVYEYVLKLVLVLVQGFRKML